MLTPIAAGAISQHVEKSQVFRSVAVEAAVELANGGAFLEQGPFVVIPKELVCGMGPEGEICGPRDGMGRWDAP